MAAAVREITLTKSYSVLSELIANSVLHRLNQQSIPWHLFESVLYAPRGEPSCAHPQGSTPNDVTVVSQEDNQGRAIRLWTFPHLGHPRSRILTRAEHDLQRYPYRQAISKIVGGKYLRAVQEIYLIRCSLQEKCWNQVWRFLLPVILHA